MTYPTLRAVLRRTRTAPATPPAEHRLEIRLRGDTFRVVDADGRTYAEVAAEVTAPRGFGLLPRTIEEFMDTTAAALRAPAAAPSEFAGDLATGRGTVVEAGREYRTLPVGSGQTGVYGLTSCSLHPGGRLVAVSTYPGAALIDLLTGSERAFIRTQSPCRSVLFEPDGALLVKTSA